MKDFAVLRNIGCLIMTAAMLWGVVELNSAMSKGAKVGQDEKEQCIVLKHQKEAEKFLDMECERYVRYKQDN